jgi:hypothetical protein
MVEIALPPAFALAEPAAPAGQDLKLEPVANDPLPLLSAVSPVVGVYPRQLAVRVVNTGLVLPSGTQLKVTFDRRLYEPLTPVVLKLGTKAIAADSKTTIDDSTGLSTCTITLKEAMPAATADTAKLIAVIGTARPLLYPRDLVRRQLNSTAEVPKRTAGAATSRRELHARGGAHANRTHAPWGIEVGGGWGIHKWGGPAEFAYYYPVLVTLRSVGPGAAPVPAGFTVSLDPRLVREISVTSVRLNGKPYAGRIDRVGSNRTDTVYESQWRTPKPLKANDVLDVRLRARLLTPPDALPSIKHPTVTLRSMGTDVAQRITGRSTLTRADSVWFR